MTVIVISKLNPMFSQTPITGSSLPPKTLCLTFDDGPGETVGNGAGPKTIPLAKYLFNENIQAAFFLTGRHIAQYPHLVQQILDYGHSIGNHTYNHPDFFRPETFINGENVISEIKKTEQLIADTYSGKNIYFRSPYGSWSPEIADMLNRDLKTDINYIGTIGWDISENDWKFWFNSQPPEECAEAYLQAVINTGRGIVVMHDSTTDNDIMRQNNRTYEAVKILVPRLKNLGYSFVSLRQIPGIA